MKTYNIPVRIYWIIVVGMFLSGFGVGLLYASVVVVPQAKNQLVEALDAAGCLEESDEQR